MEDLEEDWEDKIYPLNRGLVYLGKSLTAKDYIKAQFKRKELWDRIRKIFDDYDFLLTPTTAVPAFEVEKMGPVGPDQIDGEKVSPIGWIPFTFPFNFTGQPAASVPCGFTDDKLPVGLQIVEIDTTMRESFGLLGPSN